MQKNIIERAFEIARSGRHDNLRHLLIQLRHEGYIHIERHFSGAAIKKEIREVMRVSRGTASENPHHLDLSEKSRPRPQRLRVFD